MENRIIKRQRKEKQLVIENLKKIPIIEVACNKSGIGRTTFYRWLKQDVEFSKNVEEALDEGIKFVNDMAESQLLNAIKEGNMSAIFYWLNHRHQSYRNKIEITTDGKSKNNSLTKQQQEKIEIALGIVNKQGGGFYDDEQKSKH